MLSSMFIVPRLHFQWGRLASHGGRMLGIAAVLALTACGAPDGDVLPQENVGTKQAASSGIPLLGAAQSVAVGSHAEAVAIGDVTGDGRNDVVMTTTSYFDPENDHHVFLFRQLADGSLSTPTKVGYQGTAHRNGLVLADLNGDGLSEIVVGHDSGITILQANTVGVLVVSRVISAPRGADTLSALDVNLDGKLDLVGLSWSAGATVFIGDGHGDIQSQYAMSTVTGGHNTQQAADFNGDGLTDLAVMSGQGNGPNFSWHLQDGQGNLAPPTSYRVPGNEITSSMAVGDINGDGSTDVVLSRGYRSPAHLWLYRQQADGTLTAPSTIATYNIPSTLKIADIDGDGRQDVLVLHGGWYRLGVYTQTPTGALTPEQLFEIPYASWYGKHGMDVGDINGDGCPDVAIADYNNGLVTLAGQGCTESLPIASATASSSYYLPYYGPQKVFDGLSNSFWIGSYREDSWDLTLAMDQSPTLDTLEIDWYTYYGSPDFDVELSDDGGVSYYKVAQGLSSTDGVRDAGWLQTNTISLGGAAATHVRIVIHKEIRIFPVIAETRVTGRR